MKRWYSFIESYSPKIIYRPGATNVVADALSCIQINNLTESNESVSDQNTQQKVVLRMLYKKPENPYTIHESINVFGNTRHII